MTAVDLEPEWLAAERTEAADALARAPMAPGNLRVPTSSPVRVAGDRLRAGGSWVLDAELDVPAVWGSGHEVMWAEGEPFLLVGPSGVGKTTLMGQVVRGRLGLCAEVLGWPVAPTSSKVLYIAGDRPRQIRRALRRLFTPDDADVLEDRLVVWEGPPAHDVARHPEWLVGLAREAGADTLILDSLKDMAVGISDDEVGAGLNRAIQLCIADGIEVAGLHHQRKAQNGNKPKALEDVYGSTWITAGAGSVVLLWGAAGDPLVELVHLKQPADVVGPLKVEHDHVAGVSRVARGFDPLRFVSLQQAPVTTRDVAVQAFESTSITDNQMVKMRRKLDRLVKLGLVEKIDAEVGAGGSTGARWIVTSEGRAAVDPGCAMRASDIGHDIGHPVSANPHRHTVITSDTRCVSAGQDIGHDIGHTGHPRTSDTTHPPIGVGVSGGAPDGW